MSYIPCANVITILVRFLIRFLYIGGRLQFSVVHPMRKCYYDLSKVLNKILIHWWQVAVRCRTSHAEMLLRS